jgi:AraC family transcriptional regulator of adaptative response / DNA-3-methyladenine glycosylase II
MRALGDPDVLLGSDLAIRAALRSLGGADDAVAVATHRQAWQPWGSYASQYLWTQFLERTM